MIVIRTGDCPPGTETTLATLDAIGESTFQDARAGVGIADGDTTVLVGLGDWTNTYTHPCQVFVYTYTFSTDSYSARTRTLGDILPTASYSGSTPAELVYDGDVSTFCTRYPGVGVEVVVMYDLSGATAKSFTWGSAFASVPLVARRSTHVVMGHYGATTKVLRRWTTSGGAAVATSPSTARGWETIHIHKDLTYVYGVVNGGATVYQYDLATLTEQSSFATPTGSGTTEKLFSHANNPNIWILSSISGQKKIHEYVQGAWVLRHTITGAFQATSQFNYVNFEGSTLYNFPNDETGGASQRGYKIDPLGCNG